MSINVSQPRIALFKLTEMSVTLCKQFKCVDINGMVIEGFAVKSGPNIFAYKNSCPHTGAELNWQEDDFLNFAGSHVICSIHGALFRLYDGFCIQGPCALQSLHALPITVENGIVYLCNENTQK